VCREDDVREVRGLGGAVLPSPARRRGGRGRVGVAGSAEARLAELGFTFPPASCLRKPRHLSWPSPCNQRRATPGLPSPAHLSIFHSKRGSTNRSESDQTCSLASRNDEHSCTWRDEVGRLRGELDDVKAHLDAIQRKVFGTIAHLITAKCCDSIPLYRLEKQYQRLGIPIARSTPTDLFHRNGRLLLPLAGRLLGIIAAHPYVHADETPLRRMGTKKKAYVWTLSPGRWWAIASAPTAAARPPCRSLATARALSWSMPIPATTRSPARRDAFAVAASRTRGASSSRLARRPSKPTSPGAHHRDRRGRA
jgi:transposase IS66 family protein